MLLESDRQIIRTIKVFFEQAGYEVQAFADPQQAVIGIDRSKPDIIVLNMNLAAHSGVEFLHELRSYPDWDKIPVIVIGRHNYEEQRSYADAFSELKVLKYIHQPSSSLPDLLTEVKAALSTAKV